MKENQHINAVLTLSLPLLIGLLMLTPLVISPGVFAHFSVSKAIYARSVIEILGVVWAMLLLRSPSCRPQHSWVIIALSIYVLASVLAAIWGINTSRSIWSTFDRMTGVFDLLHWLLLALVLASVVRSPRAWRFLLNGQLAVALLLALIAATQVWGFSFIPSIIAKCRVDATMGNASYLAPILVMSILVAAGLLAQSFIKTTKTAQKPASNQKSAVQGDENTTGVNTPLVHQEDGTVWRVFWLAVIALGSLVLVYTGTRGGLIGLAAGALVMPLALLLWGNRQALLPVLLTSGGVLLTVGALFAVDSTVGLPVSNNCGNSTATARLTELAETGTNDSSVSLRLSSARAGFDGLLQRPILGWGPGNFGYAFDQNVDPPVFRQGSIIMDKAHNQVVEEFTTKGLVGGLAFLGMWAVLSWVVIRQKRPAKAEILTYAILGALGGYFVQNLFFFDTPSSLLYWVVLVAWVAWREKEDAVDSRQTENVPLAFQRSFMLQTFRRFGTRALAFPGCRAAIPVALVVVLGLSLYWFNLQPYLAARSFGQTSQHGISHQVRLARAQESFETFPPMANQTRRIMSLETLRNWQFLDDAERWESTAFFGRELGIALGEDPRDATMLIAAILFIQSTVESAEVLATVNPMLLQLYQIAPNRAETHQLLAGQAVLEGKNALALQIAAEYQERAPGTEFFFTGVERAARKNFELGQD
ncbi:MAG: O-antigen ligase family protein [Chloroflexi bacterium]|nr:O-antigen ligase family protein [Chloroflexota bacterium]MDA1218317.1 O-antigen ligase family protein [Chloroflexota bacterium]